MGCINFRIISIPNLGINLNAKEIYYIQESADAKFEKWAKEYSSKKKHAIPSSFSSAFEFNIIGLSELRRAATDIVLNTHYPYVKGLKRFFLKSRIHLSDEAVIRSIHESFGSFNLIARIDKDSDRYLIADLPSSASIYPYATLAHFANTIVRVSVGEEEYIRLCVKDELSKSVIQASYGSSSDKDSVRFSRSVNTDLTPEELERIERERRESERKEEEERKKREEERKKRLEARRRELVAQISRSLAELKEIDGIIDLVDALGTDSLSKYRSKYPVQFSRLEIGSDGELRLPDYNKEVKAPVLSRALYLLFVIHPEGLSFKEISNYREQLLEIYRTISPRSDDDQLVKSVDSICDPLENASNITISRLRAAFRSILSEDIAVKYLPSGKQGEKRRVELDRNLITMPRWLSDMMK